MRYPQVLVYESDRRLAKFLHGAGGWPVREPRSLEGCLRLLQSGGPSVLVVKLGKDLVREFTLLERVAWLYPETGIVAVEQMDNPVLGALAWDLGAACVLPPPQPRPELAEIVGSLLRSDPSAAGTEVPGPPVLEEES